MAHEGQQDIKAQEFTNAGAALEHTLKLLRTKDDTSRFVGLAILKSLLDNHATFRNDAATLTKCWEAIPSVFLDRMLRASASQKKSPQEAQSMREIAVAILHIFALLLPDDVTDAETFVRRSAALVCALKESLSTPQGLYSRERGLSLIVHRPESIVDPILEALLTIASGQAGSQAVLAVADLSPLLMLVTKKPRVLEILTSALIISHESRVKNPETDIHFDLDPQLEQLLHEITAKFEGKDCRLLFEFIYKIYPYTLTDVQHESPQSE